VSTDPPGTASGQVQELWLRVEESGDGPTVICVVEEAVIGRDFRCDVVIHDDEASRMHARVTPTEGGGWVIVDLATTNGTFVSSERIVGPARLRTGDVIRVGRVTCTVVEPSRS